MTIASPFAPIDIPNIDVWTMIMEQPRSYADDLPLFIDGDSGRSHNFAQIKEGAINFGKGLRHVFGWNKGDVLGLYTANDIDVPIVNFGCQWAGGIPSPANPTYTVDELARQLKDSGAKALVTQTAFLPVAVEASKLVGLPMDRIILLGKSTDILGNHRHWTDIHARGAWFQPKKAQIDPKKDTAFLVYSSGTTGLPKGVGLTHFNIVANNYQMKKMDFQSMNWDIDGQLGVLPFFHIYGLAVVINMSFHTGAKCVTMAKFDLERACKLIQDHRLTFIYVPPPIVLALGKHPVVDKYDLSSLRWINSAAAPVSKDLVANLWERLRVGVKQGYGLSETSPAAIMQFPEEWWRFQGSIGRLLSNMEAKIVDPQGKEVAVGEPGEILLKGPNVFAGYWNKPEMNKDTFTSDGWYRTGDVGYINPQGHFYITDRIKELIKYKGFQVPPAELEAKIIGREDIADVCVVGVWNKEQHTEVPRAYVVLRDGVAETPEKAKEIITWVSEHVSPPKRLRGGVRFVKEIPKAQSGKILRRILREQAKKEDEEPQAKL